jgi:hypothetical protein
MVSSITLFDSRSEKYGERFAIGLVAKMQLEELKHVFTELELRTEMVKMGILIKVRIVHF